MSAPASQLITQTLQKAVKGDSASAERLIAMVYDEFRSLARNYLRRKVPGHSIQATELVHETYIRLVDRSRVDWKGRSHFFAVGAVAMRRILVNRAIAKKRQKRGGEAVRITFDDQVGLSPECEEDVLAIDEALNELERLDERQAKIVELRFFGGLSVDEVAEAIGVSKPTVKREWRACRAWLRQRLSSPGHTLGV